jgi:hypothetical protein
MTIMSVPALDNAKQAQREAAAEQSFWQQHAQELLATHPDQFVAVHNGEVVAAGDDLLGVIADIEAKGLTVDRVWVKFLMKDPRRMLV